MQGIILGYSLHDYKSILKENELVCIDNEFYCLEKIDPLFMKNKGEEINPFMYLVRSKVNNEIMNFERSEISKANIAIFDSNAYFNSNKKIKLGDISPEDIKNIKYKYIFEWDLDSSTNINDIHINDLIELTFEGEIIEKEYISIYEDASPTVVKYFKLN